MSEIIEVKKKTVNNINQFNDFVYFFHLSCPVLNVRMKIYYYNLKIICLLPNIINNKELSMNIFVNKTNPYIFN